MTQPLKYQLSAAGASVESLMAQISNASLIEEAQYTLLADSTQLYVQAAKDSAAYTQKYIEDQSEGTKDAAYGQMAGGIASLCAVAVTITMASKYQAEGQALEKAPQEGTTKITAEPEAPVIPENASDIEMVEMNGKTSTSSETTATSAAKSTATTTANGQQDQAEFIGKQQASATNKTVETNAAENADQARNTEQTRADKAQTEAQEARQNAAKAAYKKADMWTQYGSQLPQALSGIATGAGTLAQSNQMAIQAKDQGLATLFGSMPTVYNNTFSLNNAVISAEEQSKQADLSVWASLIQASSHGGMGG